MNINPEEFYLMERDDFELKFTGWEEERIYQQSIVRNMTAFICESMQGGGKGSKFVYKNWKLSVDKKGGISDNVRAQLKKLRELDALNKKYPKK